VRAPFALLPLLQSAVSCPASLRPLNAAQLRPISQLVQMRHLRNWDSDAFTRRIVIANLRHTGDWYAHYRFRALFRVFVFFMFLDGDIWESTIVATRRKRSGHSPSEIIVGRNDVERVQDTGDPAEHPELVWV